MEDSFGIHRGPLKGRLVLIVGVTGSGKGALEAHLRSAFPELYFAVSCVTRPPRPGEVEGENYHFVSKGEFLERRDRGEFLEWIEKYNGIFYGTLKSEILTPLSEGRLVVREVDIDGVKALQRIIPREQLYIIAINAGSWEIVERRVKARAPIADEELATRKRRYAEENPFFLEVADTIIENPDGKLDESKAKIEEVVKTLLAR